MKSIQFLLITFVVFTITNESLAQNAIVDSVIISDTVEVIEPIRLHSPTKATLFSTLLPGLGQAYNKKYWKMPIIYASIGTAMYFGISNHKNFKDFKTAYGQRVDGDANTVDQYADILTDESLRANMDYHQRSRDLSYIMVGLFYVLNIVDAAVDAHLFNFPKNDNLSFNIQPNLELTTNNEVSKGFKLVINL